MLLSALAFVAALQVAPPPDQHDFLLKHEPFRWAQLHAKRPPRSPKALVWTAEEARARVTKRGAFKPAPGREFVVNPQITNCRAASQLISHPEALQVEPLSKMPKAHGERAVARLIDGCPSPVLIAQADPLH